MPAAFPPVAKRGNDWLQRHASSAGRPPPYWRQFNHELGQGSDFLCGYMCLWNLDGTVDHFVSIDEDRSLAYDWDNYRYVAGWINSSKQNVRSSDILDPCEVEAGWFKIILPTLELVLTDTVPADKRARAENTLNRLPIGKDGRARRKRAVYFDEYMEGKIQLNELRRRAPLIAEAIEREGIAPRVLPVGPSP